MEFWTLIYYAALPLFLLLGGPLTVMAWGAWQQYRNRNAVPPPPPTQQTSDGANTDGAENINSAANTTERSTSTAQPAHSRWRTIGRIALSIGFIVLALALLYLAANNILPTLNLTLGTTPTSSAGGSAAAPIPPTPNPTPVLVSGSAGGSTTSTIFPTGFWQLQLVLLLICIATGVAIAMFPKPPQNSHEPITEPSPKGAGLAQLPILVAVIFLGLAYQYDDPYWLPAYGIIVLGYLVAGLSFLVHRFTNQTMGALYTIRSILSIVCLVPLLASIGAKATIWSARDFEGWFPFSDTVEVGYLIAVAIFWMAGNKLTLFGTNVSPVKAGVYPLTVRAFLLIAALMVAFNYVPKSPYYKAVTENKHVAAMITWIEMKWEESRAEAATTEAEPSPASTHASTASAPAALKPSDGKPCYEEVSVPRVAAGSIVTPKTCGAFDLRGKRVRVQTARVVPTIYQYGEVRGKKFVVRAEVRRPEQRFPKVPPATALRLVFPEGAEDLSVKLLPYAG